MKKFIAIMVAVLMMFSTIAFASVQTDTIEECLGVATLPLGSTSMVEILIGTNYPPNTIIGIMFDNTGYYVEYRDGNGNYYGWMDETTPYATASLEVLSILCCAYDWDWVDGALFCAEDEVLTLMDAEQNVEKHIYNNITDYTDAAIALMTEGV